MFLMLAEVFRSCSMASALPDSRFWRFVCAQQTHAEWVGASLHDLIQPSFYFLVGIGLLFSMGRRLSSGQTVRGMRRHVLARGSILIVLGMVLVSIHPRQWTWEFTDTLTQIGLAYPFLFALARRPKRAWYLALVTILVGYWTWFALSPLPDPNFDYGGVGVSADWVRIHGLTGFAAHWQKNSNVAGQFDRWFLNLLPMDTPYIGHWTGLTSLNFIPSIGTMILGMIAGDVLRNAHSDRKTLPWLCATGLVLIFMGLMLGVLGVCPIVKAIWTPSWVLFSGGLCWLLLAAFHALVDRGGFTRTVFPLRVIGMNSIAAYSMSNLYSAFAFNGLRKTLGSGMFNILGSVNAPAVYGGAVLAMYWLVLYVLYRRRIFLRL